METAGTINIGGNQLMLGGEAGGVNLNINGNTTVYISGQTVAVVNSTLTGSTLMFTAGSTINSLSGKSKVCASKC
jgi:hypothetical protein